MSTKIQEETYNEIIKYYDFADKLVSEIEKYQDDVDLKNFDIDILHSIADLLEENSDKLTELYIEFVKSGHLDDDSKKEIADLFNNLDFLLEKSINRLYNQLKNGGQN